MLNGSLGNVKGIIFDLDDTLFDEADWIIVAMQAGAEALNLDPGRVLSLSEKFIAINGHAGNDIYNFVLLGCGQSDSARNIAAMANAIKRHRPPAGSISLFPGVRETLIELGRHHKLALLLHGDAVMQRAKVSALGLDLLVAHHLYMSEMPGGPIRWPDPRPLQMLRLEFGLEPGEILFVGDNPFRDFLQPRRAGMQTCRVLTGIYRDTAFPSPEHTSHYTITSAAQLLELLEGDRDHNSLIMQSLDFLNKRGDIARS